MTNIAMMPVNFSKNASESGFNYEAEKFEGIPTATGSYLSNKMPIIFI